MLSAANSIGGLNLGEDGILWMATENGLYSLQLADGKIEAYHNVVEEKHVCSFKNIARIGSMHMCIRDSSQCSGFLKCHPERFYI